MAKKINLDILGAILLLVISLAYGFFISDIKLLLGEEDEPFNPRTFPTILCAVGVILACAELFKSIIKQSEYRAPVIQEQRNYSSLIKLIVAVCLYGATLNYIGFLLATACFIFVCAWVLGERRKWVLFSSSVVFVLSFWALLKFGLGIYIEAGSLFSSIVEMDFLVEVNHV